MRACAFPGEPSKILCMAPMLSAYSVILCGLSSCGASLMKRLASVTAVWRPAISALNTSACLPRALLLLKTFLPWWYPATPNPTVHFPFLSDKDPSEYTNRVSLLPSSFMDFPDKFSGMNTLILLSRSTSDGLHGGSAFGIICSVSSSILWLTHVMQVVYLVFRFVLYLLDMLKGGNGGGVMGWGCALWSG